MALYIVSAVNRKESEYRHVSNDRVLNVFSKNSGKEKKQWVGDLILNENKSKITEFLMNDHLVLELPDIMFIAEYVNNFNNQNK